MKSSQDQSFPTTANHFRIADHPDRIGFPTEILRCGAQGICGALVEEVSPKEIGRNLPNSWYHGTRDRHRIEFRSRAQ